MADEATGAAPDKKPATSAELRKAFPQSTAEWREGLLDLGATMADAQGFWAEELGKKNVELSAKLAATEKRIGELEAEAKAQSAAKAKAPGFEPVESGGTSAAVGGEQQMIDEAVKAAGGNYRKGLESLQTKLMKPHTDRGLTRKAAAALCAAEYPGIFG